MISSEPFTESDDFPGKTTSYRWDEIQVEMRDFETGDRVLRSTVEKGAQKNQIPDKNPLEFVACSVWADFLLNGAEFSLPSEDAP
jgi:hypothetical protein